jgi:hypothetical protein
MKQKVTRCKACGEKSNYVYSQEDQEHESARVSEAFRRVFAASIILGGAFSFYIWANSNTVGTGRIDWILWLGLALTVVGVLRFAFLFSTPRSTRIKLLLGYWSTVLIGLIGFSFLPWDDDWIRPALNGLSLIVLFYMWFFSVAMKLANLMVYFMASVPILLALFTWINWSSQWAGLMYLGLALIAVVSLVVVVVRLKNSPTPPS